MALSHSSDVVVITPIKTLGEESVIKSEVNMKHIIVERTEVRSTN